MIGILNYFSKNQESYTENSGGESRKLQMIFKASDKHIIAALKAGSGAYLLNCNQKSRLNPN